MYSLMFYAHKDTPLENKVTANNIISCKRSQLNFEVHSTENFALQPLLLGGVYLQLLVTSLQKGEKCFLSYKLSKPQTSLRFCTIPMSVFKLCHSFVRQMTVQLPSSGHS